MSARTRYFVIVSLLVLAIGVGTGLVAYYVGFPAGAFTRRGGPEELQYLPRDAAVVAYADVHQVMTSDVRQRLHQAMPMPENGQREFENATGINIETDIDRVVACLEPSGSNAPGAGVVLARGRFDAVKIEALMRDHGAHVEDYKGTRLIVADNVHPGGDTFSLAFVEPGLVGVGTTALVRNAVDLRTSGGASVVTNDELMNLVRSIDDGNAWAVGRFDALRPKARLPENVASQLPPITWFSVSSHIDGGIRGVLRAQTRDDESANNLRDVVRGFLALAKMQAGARPEFQALAQSLELGGTGNTVALSFDVPLQVFDAMGRNRAPKAAVPRP